MKLFDFFKKSKKEELKKDAIRQRLLATPLYVPKWLADKLTADEREMAIFNYIHYGTPTPDPEVKKRNESAFRKCQLPPPKGGGLE